MTTIRRTKNVSSISPVVESYLRYIQADKPVERYRELSRWSEAVGKDLAQVTVPEKIVRNVLYVKVLDQVWAQELTLRKKEILQRLFDHKISPHLDDIVFIPGDPNQFSPSKTSRE